VNTLRARLTLGYLVVIVLGMAVAAPLAWLAVEQTYLDTQKANLLAQAALVARTVAAGLPLPAGASVPYSQTGNATSGVHTRVLDTQGAVVIDLFAVPPDPTGAQPLPILVQNATGDVTAPELLARPEIAQALAGQPATAVRTLPRNARVLYAAAPVVTDGRVTSIVYLATPLPASGWDALPVAVRWQLAGALLLAAALAAAAGWRHARALARPLRAVAGAAGAVAAGDLAQRVPETGGVDELTTLARTFNQMTAGLRRADQAKSAFVADVSHELRTPLTVIKGTIETLQDGALDDLAARDDFLSAMSAETERLIRLVNDLLVLARADADTLQLEREPCDLAALAEARAHHFAVLAARRDVRVQVVTDAPGACVPGDGARLTQVLDNLLDNAMRYAPPGSTVAVRVARDGDGLACSVSDSGAGIPVEHLPLIFERFYRADAARSRAAGGSGLGLAITRALVEAHGGRIRAQSVVGRGTTVTFWLPAR
jgi:two-component system sensor histidine kinase BaeS